MSGVKRREKVLERGVDPKGPKKIEVPKVLLQILFSLWPRAMVVCNMFGIPRSCSRHHGHNGYYPFKSKRAVIERNHVAESLASGKPKVSPKAGKYRSRSQFREVIQMDPPVGCVTVQRIRVSPEAERDMKLMVTILSVEHYLLMIFGVLQANPALLMPWLMMEAVVIALEAIFFGMRLFVEGLAINRSEVIMSAIVIHNWFQVFCFFRKYISLCDL